MRRPAWWLWARSRAARYSTVIVVVWMTAISAVAIGGVRWEIRERQDAVDAAAVERRGQICDGFARLQRSDRLLIGVVLDEPDNSGGIPLLDVASFRDLPPAVQTYVIDLAEATDPPPTAEDPPTLAERLDAFRDENLGTDDLPEFCARPGEAQR